MAAFKNRKLAKRIAKKPCVWCGWQSARRHACHIILTVGSVLVMGQELKDYDIPKTLEYISGTINGGAFQLLWSKYSYETKVAGEKLELTTIIKTELLGITSTETRKVYLDFSDIDVSSLLCRTNMANTNVFVLQFKYQDGKKTTETTVRNIVSPGRIPKREEEMKSVTDRDIYVSSEKDCSRIANAIKHVIELKTLKKDPFDK